MKIELNEYEINRILDWYSYTVSEGHENDYDDNIYNKLTDYLEFCKG